MKILEWFGEIGWELLTPELRAQLKASKGDDLIIRFSSVGGSIFEGTDIFNLLADHRRDNLSIVMNLEIKSTALSMGSAIAASPVWNQISVEATSMYMLHNPWVFAIGDFDEMQRRADFLKSARDMFARIYSARSKQSIDDTISDMSAETWFFGQEIIDAGFANRMNETVSNGGEPQDKVLVMANMKAKFAAMKKRQKESSEGFDFERAVAAWRDPGEKKPVKVGSGPDTGKTAIMKKEPEIYQSFVDEGVMIERARITKLVELKAHPEYQNFPQVVQAIDEAIASGLSEEETTIKIMEAVLLIYNDPSKMRSSYEESPGNIQGGNEQNTVLKADRITEV